MCLKLLLLCFYFLKLFKYHYYINQVFQQMHVNDSEGCLLQVQMAEHSLPLAKALYLSSCLAHFTERLRILLSFVKSSSALAQCRKIGAAVKETIPVVISASHIEDSFRKPSPLSHLVRGLILQNFSPNKKALHLPCLILAGISQTQ